MKILIILVAAFTLISCSDFFNKKQDSNDLVTKQNQFKPFPAGFDPNVGSFSEDKMIANMGLNIIAPATKKLRLQAEIFNQELRKLARTPSEAQKVKVQNLWKEVMLDYHFIDGAPVGPLSDKQLRLSEQIYSWPYANLCGVDHEVVKLSQNPSSPAPTLFTLKGLAVLEYLLFEEKLTVQCNAGNPRNGPVIQWAQKSEPEKAKDRFNYAYLISQDLVEKTKELESLWDPSTNNYTHSLIDGSLFPLKAAVNAVSDSLFSIEKIKDFKLAKPLGLSKECTQPDKKCPESVEHVWSGIAFEAMDSQVQGFEAVFFGKTPELNGFGFDDYLNAMGRGDVANHMRDNIDRFMVQLKKVAALGPLQKQIVEMDATFCAQSTVEDPKVPACGLYQDLRLITNKMKTEFLVALSLKAPPSYQGDND